MFIVCKTCSNSYHIPERDSRRRSARISLLGMRPILGGAAASDAGRLGRLDARRAGAARPRAGAACAGSHGVWRTWRASSSAPLAAGGLVGGVDDGDRGARSDRRRGAGRGGRLRGDRPSGELARSGDRGRARQGRRERRQEDSHGRRRDREPASGRRRPRPTCASPCARADGRELYVWTTRAPKEPAGARRARAISQPELAAPPEGVEDALVKFVAPGDKVAPDPEGS